VASRGVKVLPSNPNPTQITTHCFGEGGSWRAGSKATQWARARGCRPKDAASLLPTAHRLPPQDPSLCAAAMAHTAELTAQTLAGISRIPGFEERMGAQLAAANAVAAAWRAAPEPPPRPRG
jgi:hypothetical protein